MDRTYEQDRAIVDALSDEQIGAVLALVELYTHGSDYDSGRYVSARLPRADGHRYCAVPLQISRPDSPNMGRNRAAGR